MSKLEVLLLEFAEIESIARDVDLIYVGESIERREALKRVHTHLKNQSAALEPRIAAEEEHEAIMNPKEITIQKIKYRVFYKCPHCKRPVIHDAHEHCPSCRSDITWEELAK